METRYYISLKPHNDGRHYIHSAECPLLPSPWKRLFLGTFFSPEEAETSARRYYTKIGICGFCLNDFSERRNRATPAEISARDDFISSEMIISDGETMLMCCIN